MEDRLQKIISAHGVASRREAEKLIEAGKVTVNGVRATLGQKADPERDAIEVNGKPLREKSGKVYIMLHKPRGYVTTMKDELGRKTVLELVADCGERVYPVGRLDRESEGLLIMTNDGDFANRMTHPSFEVSKTYHVKVKGEHPEEGVAALSGDMVLDGVKLRRATAHFIEGDKTGSWLSVTIHEGKNRQIRRMCEQVGLEILRLVRVSEGGVSMEGLPYGKWRRLREDELKKLTTVH